MAAPHTGTFITGCYIRGYHEYKSIRTLDKWKIIMIKHFKQMEILLPSSPFLLTTVCCVVNKPNMKDFYIVFVVPWYPWQQFLYMKTLWACVLIPATLNSFTYKVFQFTWVWILAASISFACKAFRFMWVGILATSISFACKAFQFTWVGVLATSNSFTCKAFHFTWIGMLVTIISFACKAYIHAKHISMHINFNVTDFN